MTEESGPDTASQAVELIRRIGTVFQEPEHQFVKATVAEELELGARLSGAEDPGARAEDLLERLRLDRVAEANPFTLSGGEKRRLSVGTALAARPAELLRTVERVRSVVPDARLAFMHPVKSRGAIRAAYADHGVRALNGPLRDPVNGGWYSAIGPEPDAEGRGVPVDRDARKECYQHAFVLLAAATATAADRPGGLSREPDAGGRGAGPAAAAGHGQHLAVAGIEHDDAGPHLDALAHGALGASISGAGPTVFGWFDTRTQAADGASAMAAAR